MNNNYQSLLQKKKVMIATLQQQIIQTKLVETREDILGQEFIIPYCAPVNEKVVKVIDSHYTVKLSSNSSKESAEEHATVTKSGISPKTKESNVNSRKVFEAIKAVTAKKYPKVAVKYATVYT
jgi:hypothetical protein